MGWEESKAWGNGEQAERTHRENVPQPTQHRLTMKLLHNMSHFAGAQTLRQRSR